MSRRSALAPQRQFSAALGAAVVLCVLFTALLTSDLPSATKQTASTVALSLGGIGFIYGGLRAMRRTSGRRRRAWKFIAAAGVSAMVANLWSVVWDVDVVRHPSPVTEGALALALLLGGLGLLGLGEALRRGAERLVMILDGVVIGCAALLITSVLVWNERQRAEAIDMHQVAQDRIVVTGAPRFDAFFAMTAARTREEFCRDHGFDAQQHHVY